MWYRLPALIQATLILATFTFTLLGTAGVLALAKDGSADIRTFVTLHVNTLDQGETVAVVRGSDILIPVAALDQAGVHGIKGTREKIHDQEYVSLASLSPDVKFKFDLDALSLEVTVAPSHLGSVSLNLNNNRPANIDYTSGRSAYVNYAFNSGTGGSTSAFIDSGINHGEDSLHFSFTAEREVPFRRGLLYFQNDDRETSVREVVGDLDAASGDLGGSMFMGGIAIARDFNLDPYAIHFPLPSLSGLVTSPSVANVYVNGVLVQRINLPPGAFNLGNLPVTTGSANTQVIVTDAFGRSQSYSQNYYTVANLLTPGTTDYQYAAGLLRQNAFAQGDSYGPAAVVGRYRIGLTNSLTAGGRFEATPKLVSGGPLVDFKTPIGYIHLAASVSDTQGLTGAAASFGYSYTTPRVGFGISLLAQGPYYANISQLPIDDRPTSAISAFVSGQVGHGSSLSLQYFRRKMRNSGTNDQLLLTDTIPLRKGYSLSLTAERDTSTTAPPAAGLSAMLNFAVGRTNVALTTQAGSTRDNNVQIQQSPEGRYGLSYAATYDPSYNHSLNGSFLYRSQYGDAEVDYGAANNSPFTDAVRVGGGIAFIDGGVFPTRPIVGSFALVDVPNTPGVHVLFENEDVGKTDRNGKLLVADLLPNYGNSIRIDDKDVPINTSIQTVSKLIAPPAQAGATVVFPSQHLQALNGSILINLKGAQIVPQYGELTIEGNGFHADSVLGQKGEFYLENIPAGKYQAHVVFREGDCSFEFTAPATTEILVKLGTLGCAVP